jgi:hypothetical protein
LRLYSDLQISSTIIYEEIAFELEMKFSELTKDGLVDALIALKLAPGEKLKSIKNELENLLIDNLDSLTLEDLAQVQIAYFTVEEKELMKPVLGMQ